MAVFAREGADVAIAYLYEHEDAQETARITEAEGRKAFTITADLGDKEAYTDIRLAKSRRARAYHISPAGTGVTHDSCAAIVGQANRSNSLPERHI